jgi:formamidopyrimidine-DNA glycosylase
MPELPEVETIRKGLAKELVGHTLTAVDVKVPKLFHGTPDSIIGETIVDVERRSKILIIKLTKHYLLVHLKMTGQLIFLPNNGSEKDMVIGGHPDKAYPFTLPHKHTHVIFSFDNGTLFFNDLRKFGWIKIINTAEEIKPHVASLGPEYDWPELTLKYFQQKIERRPNTTIKQSLLDQTIIAGLGNIYADETLFCAKVLPTRKNSELKPNEIKRIFECIPEVLNLSLEHGGTSSQHYRQIDGKMGTYLGVANVYKREKEPCKICGTPIKRIKISGRSSHFCPNCQK